MHELINRPDFYETVLAYYEKLKIPLHRKVHLEKFLPKNPTTEDYLSIPESESEKSRKDLHFANTVNFCMTVVGGMTDGVDKNMLKKAVLVKSKWGPSGALVEHPLGLMPSNYLNDAYSYYC